MKINEELERLLQTESANRLSRQNARSVGNSGGFEDLLTQQLTQPGKTEGADPRLLEALADPLRLANTGVAALAGLDKPEGDADGDLLSALTGGMGSTLDGLDAYADKLRDAGSLKDAWSALQSLDGTIAELRQDMGRLSGKHPELESMLNELEVLAATERFKFNRGDYLPG